jgi:DNA repair protein SbcC/Rad50
MKLIHVQAENFRSFAQLDLDLNASGLFSITGPNGAGKTSIFAAVEWALYGGKRGRGAMAVERQGADGDCRVQLDFEVAGRLLRVVRVDGGTASLTDLTSGEELASGLTATSRDVAVALGLTQEMFGGTFYARQKEVEALSSDSSLDARRGQLERLLGIEHLRLAAELASSDAREQKLLVDGLSEELPDIADLQADLERSEREAQEAAPAIKVLEEEIEGLDKKHRDATQRIDALAEQLKQHGQRQRSAEKKAFELAEQQAALERIVEQRDGATKAKVELFELEPAAQALDQLTVREREVEVERRNHERLENLRAQERAALEELAAAADELSDLKDGPAEGASSAALSEAQQELNQNGKDLRAASKARELGDQRSRRAAEDLALARRAAALDTEIEGLSGCEQQLEKSQSRSEALRSRQAALKAELAHELRHRDALRGADDGLEGGVCPTCRQPLAVGLDVLLSEYETQIDDHEAGLDRLQRELDEAEAERAKDQKAVDTLGGLRANRAALGNLGAVGELEEKATAAAEAAAASLAEEQRLEAAHSALEAAIPDLEAMVAEAAEREQKRAQIKERLIKAEQQVSTYAEQRGTTTTNGYDPEVHQVLKQELHDSQEAARRCVSLRELAESEPMLERQISAQEVRLGELARATEELREKALEIAPEEDAHENLALLRDQLDEDREAKRRALSEARQKVSLESQAVSAARARLSGAHDQRKHLDAERRESELRAAVASALETYREHASRLARPMLESEASALLKRVTNGAYPAVRLTDRYLLEIIDGDAFHSSKRFSGGEQDLAAICLRLALARTLAHQRGVEHSFVVLDEVFGGQDTQRRQTLLEQLRELAEAEFQQIFVISHTDDVIDHCSLHIEVARQDGVSTARGPSG